MAVDRAFRPESLPGLQKGRVLTNLASAGPDEDQARDDLLKAVRALGAPDEGQTSGAKRPKASFPGVADEGASPLDRLHRIRGYSRDYRGREQWRQKAYWGLGIISLLAWAVTAVFLAHQGLKPAPLVAFFVAVVFGFTFLWLASKWTGCFNQLVALELTIGDEDVPGALRHLSGLTCASAIKDRGLSVRI